ncbi:TIR domain-containing protein [Frankia sp. Cj5]|uniref:TIR domain-containing protein n=2 Tax=unclassified Frankia TaxID=2632575 RepID=UPI001EF65977|nr:TIR domain-containing protein [Frankia sp. Cj5]
MSDTGGPIGSPVEVPDREPARAARRGESARDPVEAPDGEPAPPLDFFVSYTRADQGWAEWVGWQLEKASYRVLLQAWDFVPGTNWAVQMQHGVANTRRTIALLSHAYLKSVYGQTEWQAAQAADPLGFERKLLPIRLEECPRPGLLNTIVSIELFRHSTDEDAARQHLLDEISHALNGRAKPAATPRFPGGRPAPAFPPTSTVSRHDDPAVERDPAAGLPTTSVASTPVPPTREEPTTRTRGAVSSRTLGRPLVLLAGTVVLVLVAIAVAGIVLAASTARNGTPHATNGCDGTGAAVRVVRAQDDECIGYSDNASQLFGADPHLQAAERAVFRANQCADMLRGNFPLRPFVSVVYLAALTPDPQRLDFLDLDSRPRTDELAGILLQQIRQNGDFTDTSCSPTASGREPILRVIIANGGRNMRQVKTVTSNIIDLARKDPQQVSAVIGMDRSTDETAQAIAEFGNAGLPVVAPTLSGDGLEQTSPLYFQMVPPNAQEAQMIAAYAAYMKKTRVSVYYPQSAAKGDDLYIRTLVADLHEELDKKKIDFEDAGWEGPTFQKQPDAPTACTGTVNEMIFFAGRAGDFGDFLRAMRTNCPAGPQLVPIVADDAVHRYVVQSPAADNAPTGTIISFVSENALIELTQQKCFQGVLDKTSASNQAQLDLCGPKGLAVLYPEHLQQPRELWPGEWAVFGYDTAGIIVLAARTVSSDQRQPTATSIAQELQRTRYNGATGITDFTTSRVATSKKEVILTIELGTGALPTCVYAMENGSPREDCRS